MGNQSAISHGLAKTNVCEPFTYCLVLCCKLMNKMENCVLLNSFLDIELFNSVRQIEPSRYSMISFTYGSMQFVHKIIGSGLSGFVSQF